MSSVEDSTMTHVADIEGWCDDDRAPLLTRARHREALRNVVDYDFRAVLRSVLFALPPYCCREDTSRYSVATFAFEDEAELESDEAVEVEVDAAAGPPPPGAAARGAPAPAAPPAILPTPAGTVAFAEA